MKMPVCPVPRTEKDIIAEEAESFFGGDKTVEEVKAVIQRRAQLVLNEREGSSLSEIWNA